MGSLRNGLGHVDVVLVSILLGGLELLPGGLELVLSGLELVLSGLELLPGGLELVLSGLELVLSSFKLFLRGLELILGDLELVLRSCPCGFVSSFGNVDGEITGKNCQRWLLAKQQFCMMVERTPKRWTHPAPFFPDPNMEK